MERSCLQVFVDFLPALKNEIDPLIAEHPYLVHDKLFRNTLLSIVALNVMLFKSPLPVCSESDFQQALTYTRNNKHLQKIWAWLCYFKVESRMRIEQNPQIYTAEAYAKSLLLLMRCTKHLADNARKQSHLKRRTI